MCGRFFFILFPFCFTDFAYFSTTRLLSCRTRRTPQGIDNDRRVHTRTPREPQAPYINFQLTAVVCQPVRPPAKRTEDVHPPPPQTNNLFGSAAIPFRDSCARIVRRDDDDYDDNGNRSTASYCRVTGSEIASDAANMRGHWIFVLLCLSFVGQLVLGVSCSCCYVIRYAVTPRRLQISQISVRPTLRITPTPVRAR